MLFDSSFGDMIAFNPSYSDFDFNFKINPNLGDIAAIKDNNAIKQSIKNLVQTSPYERPFNPKPAMGISDYVFDKMDDISANTLITEIKSIIDYHEPRVSDTRVFMREGDRTLDISIVFVILNTDETDTVTLSLKRTR